MITRIIVSTTGDHVLLAPKLVFAQSVVSNSCLQSVTGNVLDCGATETCNCKTLFSEDERCRSIGGHLAIRGVEHRRVLEELREA